MGHVYMHSSSIIDVRNSLQIIIIVRTFIVKLSHHPLFLAGQLMEIEPFQAKTDGLEIPDININIRSVPQLFLVKSCQSVLYRNCDVFHDTYYY